MCVHVHTHMHIWTCPHEHACSQTWMHMWTHIHRHRLCVHSHSLLPLFGISLSAGSWPVSGLSYQLLVAATADTDWTAAIFILTHQLIYWLHQLLQLIISWYRSYTKHCSPVAVQFLPRKHACFWSCDLVINGYFIVAYLIVSAPLWVYMPPCIYL
jgi:hypothetical protein